MIQQTIPGYETPYATVANFVLPKINVPLGRLKTMRGGWEVVGLEQAGAHWGEAVVGNERQRWRNKRGSEQQ
jgi:hypothetical protein